MHVLVVVQREDWVGTFGSVEAGLTLLTARLYFFYPKTL